MASRVVIKQEKVANGAGPSNAAPAAAESATDIEATQARLLDLTRELTSLTQEVMDADPIISKVPKSELLNIMNPLLKNGKLKMHATKDGKPFYKLGTTTPATVSRAAANATTEEKLLLQIIEEAGSKGIWTKEMRNKSGLNQSALTKVLKAMESKKMIKSVTSVQAAKKKMYLLYDVTPDSSLTGGPWWSNGEFDNQFVELLHKICSQLLEKRLENARKLEGGPLMVKNGSFLSSAEILQMVTDMRISKTTLSVTDIECILDTIVYDGKAEMTIDGSGGQHSKRYRMIESLIPSAGFVHIPCGVCPVINRCSTIGAVTAKTCEYFESWGNDI